MPKMVLYLAIFIIFNINNYYVFAVAYKLNNVLPSFRPFDDDRPKCEPILIEVCKEMAYNQTVMPNIFNHQSQKEAEENINTFKSLIALNCSPYLRIFMCTLYAPICTDLNKLITPCKSLCEDVKRDCEIYMNQFTYKWPTSWNCSNLDDPPTCVGDNKTQLLKEVDKQNHNKFKNNGKIDIYTDGFSKTSNKRNNLQCPPKLKVPKTYQYELAIQKVRIKDCGMPCSSDKDSIFGPDKQKFAWYIVGITAIICLISTLFSIITFFVDMDRFPYPERPIIFLSGCYLAVSIAYIIGFITGESVSCSGPFLSPDTGLSFNSMPKIVVQGTKKELCTIVFMILYYFGMASCLWWIILNITWFLSAALKWGQEAIDRNSHYFHLIAWSLPAIQTIAILALGKVEGDSLVGVCYVGVYDEQSLIIFVIVPLVAYLIVGLFFLLMGLISLFRIRSVMKHEGSSTKKLERLMVRIGIFSMLYTLPAGIVVACYIYEVTLRSDWILAWFTRICHKNNFHSCPRPVLKKLNDDEEQALIYEREFSYLPGELVDLHNLYGRNGFNGDEDKLESLFYLPTPDFAIFMIKYMMTLIVGVCSGIWVWSGKTFSSFQQRVCPSCVHEKTAERA